MTAGKKEIRIAWKIGEQSGAGWWHSARNLESFRATVDAQNKKYGDGTHWIEERTV